MITLPSLTEKMLKDCKFRCKDWPTTEETDKCCGDLWSPDVFLATTHEAEILSERYRNLGSSFVLERRVSLKVAVQMSYHAFPFDAHNWLMAWMLREHRKYIRLVPMEVVWPKDLSTSGFYNPKFELLDCFEQPLSHGFERVVHATDPSCKFVHPIPGVEGSCPEDTSATWPDEDLRQAYIIFFS